MAGQPYTNAYNQQLTPSTTATVVRPQGRVTFATQGGVFTAGGTGNDPNNSLIAFTTNVTLTQIGGTFSITLAAKNVLGTASWDDVLNIMDFVVIEGRGDAADPWETIMVGFIQTVSLTESNQGSGVQRQITVKGSDFGMILSQSNMDFWNQTVPVNLHTLKASVNSPTSLYSHPTTSAPVIGTFAPNAWYPVIEQITGWVKVSFPGGSAWVPDGGVTLHRIPDPAATTLYEYITAYALTIPVTGTISVTGLETLLFNSLENAQLAPMQLSADSGTLIAIVMMAWIFKTWNVPIGYLGSNKKFELAQVSDVFHFLCTQTQGFIVPNALMTPMQGSVLNFMQSVSLTPVYEMWLDTRRLTDVQGYLNTLCQPVSQTYEQWQPYLTKQVVPRDLIPETVPVQDITFGESQSVPVLVFRETPFDPATFATLPVHQVSNADIIDKQLSKSASEIINLYYIYPDSPSMASSLPQAIANYYWPLLDGASATRYGLKELRSAWNGLPVTDTSGNLSYFLPLNEKVWGWYNKNPLYFTGTYAIGRGRPDMRIGDVLEDTSTGRSFYIEGVSHTFNQFRVFTTTVTVSRGSIR